MKKIFLSLVAAATLSLSSFGQAPEGFKYQAVVRDAGNTILNNQAVGLRMTIQLGSIGGTTVYSEMFAPTTNTYGLVNLEIGNGTVVSGTFANIDWSAGPYFMETAVDVTGGTNYSVMGTSQLMSVPYALYAKTSGNGQGPVGPAGANGIDGADGVTGAQGPAGNDGATGPQGSIGLTGADGAIGSQGVQGIAGNDGADGATGATGPQGSAGNDGATGPQGPIGLTGADGATGSQGVQGIAGNDGADGATGATGPQGSAGLDGADGATGPQGIQGIAGNDGADGQGGVTTAGAGINITGTGSGVDPYVVNFTGGSPTYTIGLWPELGGYVFWVSADGKHGLVAETQDQGINAWYEAQNLISNPSNHSVNGQEFRDWRMPTKYELNEMNVQRVAIGGFASNSYWSSTEYDYANAWIQGFPYGSQGIYFEGNGLYVRAVRAF